MKKIHFAVLDFDGTLADSEKLYRFLLGKFLFSNPFLFRFYFGVLEKDVSNLQSFFKKGFKNLAHSFYKIIETKEPEVFKGVKDFLTELKQKEIRIFLTTRSSRMKTEKILKENKLFYFFELILSGEIPKREHVDILKRYTGLTSKQFSNCTFYLGDEPIDMCLAKRHSVFPVGITNTFDAKTLRKYGAKIVISSIGELTELIKKVPEIRTRKRAHQVIA